MKTRFLGDIEVSEVGIGMHGVRDNAVIATKLFVSGFEVVGRDSVYRAVPGGRSRYRQGT